MFSFIHYRCVSAGRRLSPEGSYDNDEDWNWKEGKWDTIKRWNSSATETREDQDTRISSKDKTGDSLLFVCLKPDISSSALSYRSIVSKNTPAALWGSRFFINVNTLIYSDSVPPALSRCHKHKLESKYGSIRRCRDASYPVITEIYPNIFTVCCSADSLYQHTQTGSGLYYTVIIIVITARKIFQHHRVYQIKSCIYQE